MSYKKNTQTRGKHYGKLQLISSSKYDPSDGRTSNLSTSVIFDE